MLIMYDDFCDIEEVTKIDLGLWGDSNYHVRCYLIHAPQSYLFTEVNGNIVPYSTCPANKPFIIVRDLIMGLRIYLNLNPEKAKGTIMPGGISHLLTAPNTHNMYIHIIKVTNLFCILVSQDICLVKA